MALLMEMEMKMKNRWDVRKELEIKSIRMKIEKRSLERYGHVLRMGDERTVRKVTFGWMKQLENEKKERKKHRCTPRYWSKLAKEAGWELLHLEQKAQDRKEWKMMVKERIKEITLWEETQRNQYEGPARERAKKPPKELKCEVCDKECVSRSGLASHIRQIHTVRKKEHQCEKCKEIFNQKANMINHQKKCLGKRSEPKKYISTVKECPICSLPYSATNMARHIRSCRTSGGSQQG